MVFVLVGVSLIFYSEQILKSCDQVTLAVRFLRGSVSATISCQAILLGLWAGASKSPPWKRILALVGWVVVTGTLLCFLRNRFALRTLVGLTQPIIVLAAATAVVLWASRVRFTRQYDRGQTLQFFIESPEPSLLPRAPSITGMSLQPLPLKSNTRNARSLIALIALLGILISAMGLLMQLDSSVREALRDLTDDALGLVALWAVLGSVRPFRGVSIACAVFASVLGAHITYHANTYGLSNLNLASLIWYDLFFSVNLLGSLLVVRAVGYRLERLGQ